MGTVFIALIYLIPIISIITLKVRRTRFPVLLGLVVRAVFLPALYNWLSDALTASLLFDAIIATLGVGAVLFLVNKHTLSAATAGLVVVALGYASLNPPTRALVQHEVDWLRVAGKTKIACDTEKSSGARHLTQTAICPPMSRQ